MGLDLLAAFDGFCAAPNRQRCIVVSRRRNEGILRGWRM